MDLCLSYKDVILGIELKVWRDKKRDPQPDGIEQLKSYLGRLGVDFGWGLSKTLHYPSYSTSLGTKNKGNKA